MIEDSFGSALNRILELEKQVIEAQREAKRHKEAREKIEKGQVNHAAENEKLKKENAKLQAQIGTMRKLQAASSMGQVLNDNYFDPVARMHVVKFQQQQEYSIPEHITGTDKQSILNNLIEGSAKELGRKLLSEGHIKVQLDSEFDPRDFVHRYVVTTSIYVGK